MCQSFFLILSILACIRIITWFCDIIYFVFFFWKQRNIPLRWLKTNQDFFLLDFRNDLIIFFIMKSIWNILNRNIGIILLRIIFIYTKRLFELFFCKFVVVFIIIFYIGIYFSAKLVKRTNRIFSFTNIF